MVEFNLPATVVGGIALALVVAGSLIFLPSIVETETELKTSARDIEVINAAHLVKACLEASEEIPEAILESYKGKGVCEICGNELMGFCKTESDLGFKVNDMESPKEWDFGYTGKGKHTIEIFVNILHDTGRVTMGRLYAEI